MEIEKQTEANVSCATNRGIDDLEYYFSSARFYETGVDEFGFLTNLFNVFDGD